MKKRTGQWIKSAEYRFKSAEDLMKSGQYLDAVFHCQQSIEYVVKAALSEQSENDPPREHDLLELSRLLKTPVPPAQKKTLDELHDISVPLRYPDDFDEAVASYEKEGVERIVHETEEVLGWFKQTLS